jgi:hypothetical protein
MLARLSRESLKASQALRYVMHIGYQMVEPVCDFPVHMAQPSRDMM